MGKELSGRLHVEKRRSGKRERREGDKERLRIELLAGYYEGKKGKIRSRRT